MNDKKRKRDVSDLQNVSQKNRYIYTDLSNLRGNPGNINIYGVIVDYTTPKFRFATKYGCEITISSPSLGTNQYVKIYADDALERLPSIKMIGQIFRGHRVLCTSKNHFLKLQVSSVSSCVIIDPFPKPFQEDEGLEYLHSKFRNNTWEPQDVMILNELSQYSNQVIQTIPPVSKYLKSFEQLTSKDNYVDIVAKVVGCFEEDESLIAKIWDGTSYFDSRYIAEVFVTNRIIADRLRDLPINTWVKFRNLAFSEIKGLVAHDASSLSVLPSNHIIVEEILKRVKSGEEPENEPTFTCVTEHEHFDIGVTSIESLHMLPDHPIKLRLQGRVVGFEPPSFNYFTQPFCPDCGASLNMCYICLGCGFEKDKNICPWHFRFKIILQSSTSNSRVSVIVEKENAARFLGIRPHNSVTPKQVRTKSPQEITLNESDKNIPSSNTSKRGLSETNSSKTNEAQNAGENDEERFSQSIGSSMESASETDSDIDVSCDLNLLAELSTEIREEFAKTLQGDLEDIEPQKLTDPLFQEIHTKIRDSHRSRSVERDEDRNHDDMQVTGNDRNHEGQVNSGDNDRENREEIENIAENILDQGENSEVDEIPLINLRSPEGRAVMSKLVQTLQDPQNFVDICVERYKSKRNMIVYRLIDTRIQTSS